jgi:molecular chaperone DnaK (HSP70)
MFPLIYFHFRSLSSRFFSFRSLSSHFFHFVIFLFRSLFQILIGIADSFVALQDCLDQSGLKKEDIYSVEIVGGSSRIPSIKTLIEKVTFGTEMPVR